MRMNERRESRIAWWRENPVTYGEAYAGPLSNGATFFFREVCAYGIQTHLERRSEKNLKAMPENERIFIATSGKRENRASFHRKFAVSTIALLRSESW